MGEYDKNERRAIGNLSGQAGRLFEALKGFENGQIKGVAELCSCLERGPELLSFSCLSGDQTNRELGENLGTLFTERKIRIIERMLEQLAVRFTLFIDDTEPVRIWQWPTPQIEISEWCRLVIESSEIPAGWSIKLWSEMEIASGFNYEEVLREINKPEHALLVHQRLSHMKEFPNRKVRDLRGKDLEDAALRRVAQYALQGLVLEKKMPSAILLQGETPWAVKDPLYQAFRKVLLPVVHPFEERR